MENSSMKMWAIAATVIVLALIGYVFYERGNGGTTLKPFATTTSVTSSTTINGVTGTGNFSVSNVPEISLNIPDFRAPIVFSSSVSSDVRVAISAAAKTLEDRLAKDSLDLKSWVDLGTLRKMGGDYRGAESAWAFVTQAAPTNSIAYHNLADLYANFLKNYPKAEAAYLTVIKLSPEDTSSYSDLSILYSNVYKKGTSAAADILKKGIGANPNSVDLQVLLARYYKSVGRTADAKTEYDAAIANANRLHQSDLAMQIRAEAGE